MSNNSYKIKFTPKAAEDLEIIYGYIANDLSAEKAALNLTEKIRESIMRLKEYPFSCSNVNDELLRCKGYRKLVVNNYIVFYIVNEKERQVIIMRILFGAQNYIDIL